MVGSFVSSFVGWFVHSCIRSFMAVFRFVYLFLCVSIYVSVYLSNSFSHSLATAICNVVRMLFIHKRLHWLFVLSFHFFQFSFHQGFQRIPSISKQTHSSFTRHEYMMYKTDFIKHSPHSTRCVIIAVSEWTERWEVRSLWRSLGKTESAIRGWWEIRQWNHYTNLQGGSGKTKTLYFLFGNVFYGIFMEM